MIYPFWKLWGEGDGADFLRSSTYATFDHKKYTKRLFKTKFALCIQKKLINMLLTDPPADKNIFLALTGWCNTCLNDVNLPGKFRSDRTVISRHIANLSPRSLFGYAGIRTHDPCNTRTTWDTTKLFAPCHSQITCLCWCKIFSSPSLPFRSCDRLKNAKCLIFGDFPCIFFCLRGPLLAP